MDNYANSFQTLFFLLLNISMNLSVFLIKQSIFWWWKLIPTFNTVSCDLYMNLLVTKGTYNLCWYFFFFFFKPVIANNFQFLFEMSPSLFLRNSLNCSLVCSDRLMNYCLIHKFEIFMCCFSHLISSEDRAWRPKGDICIMLTVALRAILQTLQRQISFFLLLFTLLLQWHFLDFHHNLLLKSAVHITGFKSHH